MKKLLSIFVVVTTIFVLGLTAVATELAVFDVVPDGATYYVGVTTTSVGEYSDATASYGSGESMPELNVGDVFVYGDYEYRYGKECDTANNWVESQYNGWGVRVFDTDKSSYGQICARVNNADVTSIRSAFSGCSALETTPEIPAAVTNMRTAFYNCSALTTAPEIPDGVTSLQSTFAGCSSLATAPVIPDSVTHIGSAFDSCVSLVTAPEIPYGVQNMKRTFFGCTRLVVGPSTIPDSVTTLEKTFYGCTALTNAPAIPESVSDVSYAFYKCKKLTEVEVNGNPASYNYFVSNSGVTEIIGFTGMKTELLETNDFVRIPEGGTYYSAGSVYNAGNAFPDIKHGDKYVYGDYEYTYSRSIQWVVKAIDKTKNKYGEILSEINGKQVAVMSYTFNGCTNMTESPIIPETVTDMTGTFYGCIALESAPAIPDGVTTLNRTFMNCTSMVTGPQSIPDTVKDVQYTFYKCKTMTTAPDIPDGAMNTTYTFYKCTNLELPVKKNIM
ncbi:MAG: leucine-rich repeat protein [Clostridia bacterium]|nr:leucine-rich repeat protein [Clostridia bacterium]